MPRRTGGQSGDANALHDRASARSPRAGALASTCTEALERSRSTTAAIGTTVARVTLVQRVMAGLRQLWSSRVGRVAYATRDASRRITAPWLRMLALSAPLFAASGCAASFHGDTGYGYTVVAVDTVPHAIHTYPRVWYHGTYVYLVNGVWYAPRGNGWVRYYDEPYELRRHRRYYGPRPIPPRTHHHHRHVDPGPRQVHPPRRADPPRRVDPPRRNPPPTRNVAPQRHAPSRSTAPQRRMDTGHRSAPSRSTAPRHAPSRSAAPRHAPSRSAAPRRSPR